jgi:hypothetical protein
VALLLLTLLLRSYANLITTLTYGKTTIIASEITAALLSCDQREKKSTAKGVGGSEGVGLATRYNQDGRKGKEKPRKEGPRYFYCKDFGHIRRECPTWKKVDGSSSVVASLDSDFDGDMFTLSSEHSNEA